jgi:hypothetical protein
MIVYDICSLAKTLAVIYVIVVYDSQSNFANIKSSTDVE